MSEVERLKELVERFRDMGRAEAERMVSEGEHIDLSRLDGESLRALTLDAAAPMAQDAEGVALLVGLAQEALFVELAKAFSERVLELRKS